MKGLTDQIADIQGNTIVDPQELKEQVEFDDLTVQLEQFISTAYEQISIVMMKAFANKEADPKIEYHSLRQLVLYLNTLKMSMYDAQINEAIIDFFDTHAADYTPDKVDEHLIHEWNRSFYEFFIIFYDNCNLKQKHELKKVANKVKQQLNSRYGYAKVGISFIRERG